MLLPMGLLAFTYLTDFTDVNRVKRKNGAQLVFVPFPWANPRSGLQKILGG